MCRGETHPGRYHLWCRSMRCAGYSTSTSILLAPPIPIRQAPPLPPITSHPRGVLPRSVDGRPSPTAGRPRGGHLCKAHVQKQRGTCGFLRCSRASAPWIFLRQRRGAIHHTVQQLGTLRLHTSFTHERSRIHTSQARTFGSCVGAMSSPTAHTTTSIQLCGTTSKAGFGMASCSTIGRRILLAATAS